MVKQDLNGRPVAENRKARYNYAVEDTFEAGIVLTGTEVKALRKGTANIAESYAEEKNGEIWLINAHIDEFSHGNIHNHEPRRPRKLLLHRKEINKITGVLQRAGMTLVPLKVYFDNNGRAKILVGLAKGKKAHDKREDIKQRDWDRQKQRLLKDFG
ncbi:SsrA-binding protein [Iodidimonas gelatinilytica]|uniref:SsrA-binding protein n=1 Tax=Iodidimonas gelatinilytica TaxID=1236966 RepID=A0A5A7MWY6_9PROT|nr:SsrA-binding protein SmpB [Iodidimonas gelatinilytica]GER00573.1 SsrA-binding protein [Iodidimonas gelatinilytica]